MPKGGVRFRKIPGEIRKFPLLFSRRVWYTMGVVERRLPARCDGSFFILTFCYRGCRISVWIAGLPAAVCGWKLEAEKHAGDNPPAESVQVITRPPRPRRSVLIRTLTRRSLRRLRRVFFEQNEIPRTKYVRGIFIPVKKPRRACRPQAANKMESFFAGACTWQKILLSLQVWNLFAFSEQIMRAADCKPFVPKRALPFLEQQIIPTGQTAWG